MKSSTLSTTLLTLTSILITGCSSSAKNVDAYYVSPAQYSAYNCQQIAADMQRVATRVQGITNDQNDHATKDKVAVGAGIIFWPALFFLIGDDKKEELARLKGEYEALEQASIQKNCTQPQEK